MWLKPQGWNLKWWILGASDRGAQRHSLQEDLHAASHTAKSAIWPVLNTLINCDIALLYSYSHLCSNLTLPRRISHEQATRAGCLRTFYISCLLSTNGRLLRTERIDFWSGVTCLRSRGKHVIEDYEASTWTTLMSGTRHHSKTCAGMQS